MYKGNFETTKIIQIVMNQECKIQYSSIGHQRTYYYIKELDILENISIDLPVRYTSGDYFVDIDKFYISHQFYYIIIINPKSLECYNCSRALIDDVTGLYNRSYWEQTSSGIHYHPSYRDFSLILIDIDNLKNINDTYGHIEGDKAIKMVGQAIRSSIRKEDIGIRYGGDEFLVLLLNKDKKDVDKVIKRIRREIYKQTSGNIDVQISAGVVYNNNLNDIEETIKVADKNLYKEKKIKKSRKQVKTDILKDLREEIEKTRNELNRKVIEKDGAIRNLEIDNLSQRLERLVVKYLKDI